MKSALLTAAYVVLVGCGTAHLAVPTYSLHEKRSRNPRHWRRGERVERDAILPIRIGLIQNNLHRGEEYLIDVYVSLLPFLSLPLISQHVV